jgi:hypothetical protein
MDNQNPLAMMVLIMMVMDLLIGLLISVVQTPMILMNQMMVIRSAATVPIMMAMVP